MLTHLRTTRDHTPGWIYTPAVPAFFFTGGYCCGGVATKYTIFAGLRLGAIPIQNADAYETDTWARVADTPSPARSQCAAARFSGQTLLIAGTSTTPPFYFSQVDSFGANTWSSFQGIPAARFAHTASASIATVFVVCGRNSSQNNVSTGFRYSAGAWSTMNQQPPPARSFATCTVLQNALLVFGGIADGANILVQTEQFDEPTENWSTKTPLPLPGRFGAATFALQRSAYVVAGNSGFGNLLQSTQCYSMETWSSCVSLPLPSRYHSSG
ncbi:MAG: hypothetical protein NT069_20845, partial [Planctomycetota bacterium]|nr:hypothetical protein [Planctomycetota bacterium]